MMLPGTTSETKLIRRRGDNNDGNGKIILVRIICALPTVRSKKKRHDMKTANSFSNVGASPCLVSRHALFLPVLNPVEKKQKILPKASPS
jgi:hypothetical protein